MTEGKALIRYFCVPYDTIHGVPKFRSPADAPDKWQIFKAYNKRDVETEMEIEAKISKFPVPQSVWEEYILDQKINDFFVACVVGLFLFVEDRDNRRDDLCHRNPPGQPASFSTPNTSVLTAIMARPLMAS